MLKNFQELEAWRKAHELTLSVYRLTIDFPPDERFGLVSQLRRCTSSIPANIAEGFGRRSTKDFVRYLEMASGSLEETRYFLVLARDLGYIKPGTFTLFNNACDNSGRLLGGLTRSLRKRISQ